MVHIVGIALLAGSLALFELRLWGVAAALPAPDRRDRAWTIEPAPLVRLQAWRLEAIAPGTQLSVVGCTHPREKGDAVLRAEYVFVGGRTCAMRSSPA